jgi:chorismate mutase
MSEAKKAAQPPSLEAVRQRIDALDGELLRLVDERASLARVVAAAKQAAGDGDKFGLRPAREAAILRRLIAAERGAASPALIVRIWRELIGDSLSVPGPVPPQRLGRQGPRPRGRAGPPPLRRRPAAQHGWPSPRTPLAQARTSGGVAVCALTPDSAWWGRLLAEPQVKVFAALPCLAAWGRCRPWPWPRSTWSRPATTAPSGSPTRRPAAAVEERLSRDGVAADLALEAGGLKLFCLAGFYQRDDARLARAPGRLSGVIGAAPAPLDV